MNTVQRLYHLGHAKWYNPFRTLWTFFIERSLEKDFMTELNKNVIPNKEIVELGCGTWINIGRLLSLENQYGHCHGSSSRLQKYLLVHL
jgi:hypothetical protein